MNNATIDNIIKILEKTLKEELECLEEFKKKEIHIKNNILDIKANISKLENLMEIILLRKTDFK
jgi:hypothetical protein